MSSPGSHERRFQGEADRLRRPERVALLEVDRVVSLCLDGREVTSVLDVGTGTGLFAEAFAKAGLAVCGVDPNAGLLEVARRHVPEARLEEGVAERLPWADGSLDLVFLGHVLHEVDDPVAALREARRVARRAVAVLEWPWVSEEIGPPLEHRLKPGAVEALAKEAGFAASRETRLARMEFFLLTP